MKRTIIAFIPLVVLIALLALDISIFGSDSILGASQVALLVAAGVCVALSMCLYKTPWKEFEKAIAGNVGDVASAILILFLIGAISGTWMMSGVVPAFIYYGIKIISPKVFLLTACILCAVVSVMTGSSWTTIATVGVALLGIGRAEGFSDAMTAGAIISGAYFGDKISPLSDTTVLASSLNKVGLFEHIRYMYITTVPSFTITLIVFAILGFTHGGVPEGEMGVYSSTLSSTFRITPWVMVVPAITAVLIMKRLPAIIVLALSSLAAAVAAVIFQPDIVYGIGSGVTAGSAAKVHFAGIVEMVYNTVSLDTGVPEVNQLVTSRGMSGMLNTVYLIICAMCFGACMKGSGMLATISGILAHISRSRAGLVGSTVATGTVLNEVKNREAAKAHKAAVELAEAKETAEKLEGVVVTVKVKGGSAESGKLFGSVTAKDIGDALEKEHGITVDRRKINLDEPIKKFGKYEIPVKLHPQVAGTVNVIVTGV